MIAPDVAAKGPAAGATIPPDRVFTGHPVKLPVFEGPLDLLLYLIQRDEIPIFDIPIEHITSEYLSYLGQLEALNVEVAGEFVVMAAHLMEIKSRMLLPQQQRPEEDEEESGDPRAELVARLIEYRRYRTVAEELRSRAELQRFVFSRAELENGNGNGNGNGSGHAHTDADQPLLLLNEVSSFDLWAAFQGVLDRAQEAPSVEVVRPRFTVRQKMAAIAAQLRWSEEGIRFVALFPQDSTRLEVIVTFLALLELIRLRRAQVAQKHMFGEIWVLPARASDEE